MSKQHLSVGEAECLCGEKFQTTEDAIACKKCERQGKVEGRFFLWDPCCEHVLSFLVAGAHVMVVDCVHPDVPASSSVLPRERAREVYRQAKKAGWVAS